MAMGIIAINHQFNKLLITGIKKGIDQIVVVIDTCLVHRAIDPPTCILKQREAGADHLINSDSH
jgi:hypothetical protein